MGNMQLSQSDPNEQVELLIQKYGNSPWVKSIVASLPMVGAFVDSHFNSMANEIYQRRIESLFSELHQEIQFLNSRKIDEQFLASEEFFDLAQNAFSRVIRISDIERTSTIARIIAESITGNPPSNIPSFDLINVIGEMSPSEALMFGEVGKIYMHHRDRLSGSENTLFAVDDVVDLLPTELKVNASFLCARLESKGLLGSIFDNYCLEPAGEELLKYFKSQCL
ncbi:TPA: hypothetical protein ACMDN5_002929 [Vibrio cholerae]